MQKGHVPCLNSPEQVDKGRRGLHSPVPKPQGLGTRLGTWVYIEITSSSSIPSSGRTPYVQVIKSNLVCTVPSMLVSRPCHMTTVRRPSFFALSIIVYDYTKKQITREARYLSTAELLKGNCKITSLLLTLRHTRLASSPGHSQILSRSHGENSGEGLGSKLRKTTSTNRVHVTY